MSTSKVLQTPVISSIDGSTIRVEHPDISRYIRTTSSATLASGGTALTVRDNNGFADDDWLLLGDVGHAKSESVDVNGAVSRGTAITVTNYATFSHEVDIPVTKILERGIKIYGAASDGGVGTLIASIDAITASGRVLADAVMIQWDKPFTSYTLVSTDTTYAYYYATFTDGTTDSSASEYVPSSGLAYNTGYELVEAGLNEVNAVMDGELITKEWLLSVVNDFQDEVTGFVDPSSGNSKDWAFEVAEDSTSLTADTNENEYLLSSLSPRPKYTSTNQAMIQVKFGPEQISPQKFDEYERAYDGMIRTEVATQATTGQTTLVVDSTVEFPSSGTIYAGSMTLTYTAKDNSTNTFSGIPSSGTGSITSTLAADSVVWSGITPGKPDKYNIFNGTLRLNRPVDSSYDGYKIKCKYYKALSRLTSLSETTDVTVTNIAPYYIGARIEERKKNIENAQLLMQKFRGLLTAEASKEMSQNTDPESYYVFGTLQREPSWLETDD